MQYSTFTGSTGNKETKISGCRPETVHNNILLKTKRTLLQCGYMSKMNIINYNVINIGTYIFFHMHNVKQQEAHRRKRTYGKYMYIQAPALNRTFGNSRR